MILALNIVNRSYLEAARTAELRTRTSIGFNRFEKLAVQVFGDNEYSLRLFPLLSSIVLSAFLVGTS